MPLSPLFALVFLNFNVLFFASDLFALIRELSFVFLVCNLKIFSEILQSPGLFIEAFELSIFPPKRKRAAEAAELQMIL